MRKRTGLCWWTTRPAAFLNAMDARLATIGDGIAFAAASLSRIDGPESFVAVHLDGARQVLARTAGVSARADRLALPLRRIFSDALAADAVMMLLAHSHPGGDPEPSRADIESTRQLVAILRAIEIELVDHIIVVPGGQGTSLRARGLL